MGARSSLAGSTDSSREVERAMRIFLAPHFTVELYGSLRVCTLLSVLPGRGALAALELSLGNSCQEWLVNNEGVDRWWTSWSMLLKFSRCTFEKLRKLWSAGGDMGDRGEGALENIPVRLHCCCGKNWIYSMLGC